LLWQALLRVLMVNAIWSGSGCICFGETGWFDLLIWMCYLSPPTRGHHHS
jgi:hypothetical protein